MDQAFPCNSAGAAGAASVSSGLLGRVQDRQPEAWRRLVHLCGPMVYAWCRQSGVAAVDAADVSQEVFRAVAAAVGRFRPQGPEHGFRGWLWTITRNKIRDHFRRCRTQPVAKGGSEAQDQLLQLPDRPPDSAAPEGERGALYGLARRGLELVRAEFEPSTWQAFWRTTVDQQAAAAVADELGMTAAAVYQAKSRVLRRLRRELSEMLD